MNLKNNIFDISREFKGILSFKIIVFILSIVSQTCIQAVQENNEIKMFNKVLSAKHKKLASFNFDPVEPLSSRVRKMPLFLLMELRRWEKKENLYPYFPTPREIKIIESYYAMLPKKVEILLKERLIGVYFIENMSGGGLTNWVVDENNQVYCYIIFPVNLFTSPLSEWLSNKDSLNFLDENNPEALNISIYAGTGLLAFYYALFHEIGHVVDYVNKVTPYLWPEMKHLEKSGAEKRGLIRHTPFTENVWQDDHNPTRENNFYYRKYYVFPGSGRFLGLEIHEAQKLYREFSTTAFVSLYAAKNWAEDFAEFFVFYHLTQVLKKPYVIRLRRGTRIDFQYEPMKSAALKKRFFILENYLKN